ncbi:MAG: hypothetical protein WDZ93_01750 [Candidatus Paceibacterota bacterium]
MVQSQKAASTPKLSPEEFVLRAIVALKNGKSNGIHVVHSGFNNAFREHFGNAADPIATTTQMRKDGKIAILLSRGGVRLYLREDLTEVTLARHDEDWEKRDREGFQKKAPPPASRTDDPLAKILKG